jgi:hypothetical protein
MSMQEPGLDKHEWVSRFESLEDDLRADPAAALPDVADLVEQMLAESGYDVDDPVAESGGEREILDEFRAARELTDRIEGGADVDPAELAAAARGLRAVVAYVVEQRPA